MQQVILFRTRNFVARQFVLCGRVLACLPHHRHVTEWQLNMDTAYSASTSACNPPQQAPPPARPLLHLHPTHTPLTTHIPSPTLPSACLIPPLSLPTPLSFHPSFPRLAFHRYAAASGNLCFSAYNTKSSSLKNQKKIFNVTQGRGKI